MIEKLNQDFSKQKTFSKLKINKIERINKIIDKNTEKFNKLFQDLYKMVNPLDIYSTNNSFYFHKKKITINKTDIKTKPSIIKDKFNILSKKSIKYNLSFNNKTIINTDINKNKNNFSIIKSPLTSKNVECFKKKLINIKPIKQYKKIDLTSNISINNKKKEKNLFLKKIYLNKNNSKKISFENDNSKNNNYTSFYYCKNEDNNLKTFITQQKKKIIHKNNLFDKRKFIKLKKRNANTNPSIFRQISKNKLYNYINDSSNILNKYYFKFLEEEESVNSTINTIKNLLEEQEKNQSLNKQLNEYIKEDINISKLRKTMKVFKNSLKAKINLKTNDLFKSPMITKKIADIINSYDSFSKMNDIYFYKNKKEIFRMNPSSNDKINKDLSNNKNKTQLYFFSPKNKICN